MIKILKYSLPAIFGGVLSAFGISIINKQLETLALIGLFVIYGETKAN